jgi:hypothetical protein
MIGERYLFANSRMLIDEGKLVLLLPDSHMHGLTAVIKFTNDLMKDKKEKYVDQVSIRKLMMKSLFLYHWKRVSSRYQGNKVVCAKWNIFVACPRNSIVFSIII